MSDDVHYECWDYNSPDGIPAIVRAAIGRLSGYDDPNIQQVIEMLKPIPVLYEAFHKTVRFVGH